jgi:hypothetical protein
LAIGANVIADSHAVMIVIAKTLPTRASVARGAAGINRLNTG